MPLGGGAGLILTQENRRDRPGPTAGSEPWLAQAGDAHAVDGEADDEAVQAERFRENQHLLRGVAH